MSIRPYLYILIIGVSLISCKKFIEVGVPKTQLVTASVFKNDATAKSAMDGIYSLMMSNSSFASANVTVYSGLSADEFDNYSTTQSYIELYSNSITVTNGNILSLWTDAYKYIYDANSVLEGLKDNQNVSSSMKQELEGEAKFIRAFCYFYLTNLYGDIPLVLTTDYRISSVLSRTSQDSVYNQIISDLTSAQSELLADYSFSNGERTRPNKYAATALLARVYLFAKQWANAEEAATELINDVSVYRLENNLDSVFLKNSHEAIFQLAPVRPNENTREEIVLAILIKPGTVALTSNLVNSFEGNDKRRQSWIDSISSSGMEYYFPYKYKIFKTGQPVTEYYMMLRLAEQYLIRAEANAEQNKLSDIDGAVADLNIIRHRAGLPDYNGAGDQQSVLTAILNERKHEFFAEWGHRWLDLKRTNTANTILSYKPDWQSSDALYPIPQSEILNDGNLSQNPGYNGNSQTK